MSRSFSSRPPSCAYPQETTGEVPPRRLPKDAHGSEGFPTDSYTKFQALVGPWDHVAEGAYHQLVAG